MPHAWCPLPWMHSYISPDGKIRPCCSTDTDQSVIGDMRETTIDDAMRSAPLIKEMRRQMMSEQRPEVCRQCYATDDAGGISYREWAVRTWGDRRGELESRTADDGSVSDFNMLYMDIRSSNLCNLTCRTCSPFFSSALAAQHRKMPLGGYDGPVLHAVDPDGSVGYLDQLLEHLDHVEEVYFAGGEPLLMDDHVAILETLLSKGRTDIRIRYSTNMTSLDRRPVLDLWRRFPSIRVVASIDSWGSRAEYIRPGCDWATVESNMLAVRRHAPNVLLAINTVVSVLNFLTMREFWLYLYESGILLEDSYGSSWTKLYYSREFRMNNLPLAMRRQGILSIEDLVARLTGAGRYTDAHMDGFRDYLDLWNHPDIDAKPCIHAIEKIDLVKGVRCHDYLPELVPFLVANGYE